MLALAALCCAVVCFASALVSPGGPSSDGRALPLAVAQLLGGAALAAVLGWLLGLTPSESAALMLLGAAPGTVAANPLVALAGGDVTLSQRVTLVGGLLGPVVAGVIAAWHGGAGALIWLALAAVLPALAGARLRLALSAEVQRLAPALAGAALAVMILTGLVLGRAGAVVGPLAAATLVLAGVLTVVGWVIGRRAGQGATAGMVLPLRNVAVPMLAGFAAGMPAAPLAAALYGILMYIPAVALVFARVAQTRR